jgi:transposase
MEISSRIVTPTVSPVCLNEQRLWALYCVGGMSYREITEATGWSWDAVKQGIQKWRLAWNDPNHFTADETARLGLAREFELDGYTGLTAGLTETALGKTLGHAAGVHDAAQQAFRKCLKNGGIGWKEIDDVSAETIASFLAQCLRDDMSNPLS